MYARTKERCDGRYDVVFIDHVNARVLDRKLLQQKTALYRRCVFREGKSMDVQVEETSSYVRKVSITVAAEAVDQAYSKALRNVHKKADWPGFRKGKVPVKLVESRLGPEILQAATEMLIDETLDKALGEHKVDAVALMGVQPGSFVRGQVFSYVADVEVVPVLGALNLAGLQATKMSTEVSDEDVQKRMASMQDKAAELVPVTDRDTVQENDQVLVDYVGTMGGEVFEGGSATNALVDMQGKQYIPGFAEGLLGAKVPGERTVSVDFPEDYSAKELAGRSATFKFTLKELKTHLKPELNDDFAQDEGFESLADMSARLRTVIEKERAEAKQARQMRDLMAFLRHNNPVEVPPSLVSRQADASIRRSVQQMSQMFGEMASRLRPEDFASLRQSVMPRARAEVHEALLMRALVKELALEASEEETAAYREKRLAEIAEQASDRVAEYRAFYLSEDGRRALSEDVVQDKVLDFLLSKAELVDEVKLPESVAAQE